MAGEGWDAMPISAVMALGLLLPASADSFQQYFSERQLAGEQYCRGMALFVATAAERRGQADLAEAAVLVAQAADDRLRAWPGADANGRGAMFEVERARQLAALYARVDEPASLEGELIACAQML